MTREVYGRPVTRAAEATSSWRAVWALRLAALVLLGGLVYGLVLLIIDLRIAGG